MYWLLVTVIVDVLEYIEGEEQEEQGKSCDSCLLSQDIGCECNCPPWAG